MLFKVPFLFPYAWGSQLKYFSPHYKEKHGYLSDDEMKNLS